MPFSMSCTTKGCGKTMEPYLDPKTDKVYCSACDNEMTNVTHFTKVQMKTLRQFKEKKVISFAVKCQKCGKEDRPKLVGEDIVCRSCKKTMDHLSEPFKIMLREKLKTVAQDV
jgi:hypothetical protein